MQYAIEFGNNCDFQVSQVKLILYDMCTQNVLKNLTVKEFCKLVYICLSMTKSQVYCFFETQCIYKSSAIAEKRYQLL